MKVKYLMTLAAFAVAGTTNVNAMGSDNLQYCSGTVKSIVTRSTAEATYVQLNNNGDTTTPSGRARIGGVDTIFDFFDRRPTVLPSYTQTQRVHLDMVQQAYYKDETVVLELQTFGYEFNSCTDFEDGIPVRFVGIGDVF